MLTADKSYDSEKVRQEAKDERALAVVPKWSTVLRGLLLSLRRDAEQAGQARELLDPVYGWFTEGFDTTNPV